MDPDSSGEEPHIKARKPYTITKQRERWTDEEHDRFLEALKLYGRAWQRIEEHIGTKTAVQIRSHAQKFFTKLEKEAFVKGVPVGHAFSIDIPPPRPKRKPSNPYPRKTNVVLNDGKLSTALDLEKEPYPVKPCDVGNEENPESNSHGMASVLPGNACTQREHAPLLKETNMENEATDSHITADAEQHSEQSGNKQLLHDDGSLHTSKIGDSYLPQEKHRHSKGLSDQKQSKNNSTLPTADVQASQNCPRHVPVHILDGSFGMDAQNVPLDKSHVDPEFHKSGAFHGHPGLFMNPSPSANSEHHSNASSSSIHQSFPDFHPLSTPFQNQDDYRSQLQISSIFPSLIVSALLQNPAAHAAATFAATLWPCVTMQAPAESSTGTSKGFQSSQINAASNMAAIAATTVAAATAWWAAHGLLPFCPPFHPGFTSSNPSETIDPTPNSSRPATSDRIENSPDVALEGHPLKQECLEAIQKRLSDSKSQTLSLSSFCEASQGEKVNSELVEAEIVQVADRSEQLDSNKSQSRKQVDRSSCGSNTPSSSDVETDGLEKYTEGKEEKHVKDKEPMALDENHPFDHINRCCRSLNNNNNDSWKAVSEEGRLAFQALFNREILPQSFSPRDSNFIRKKNSDKENTKERKEKGSQIDASDVTWSTISESRVEEIACLSGVEQGTGPQKVELGHTKLKICRTGFKPYKRCSMEANKGKLSTNGPEGEKGPKRLRQGTEDST